MISGDFVVEVPCKEQPEWVNDGGFCYLLDFFPKGTSFKSQFLWILVGISLAISVVNVPRIIAFIAIFFSHLTTLFHAPFVVDCNHHHLVISPFFADFPWWKDTIDSTHKIVV